MPPLGCGIGNGMIGYSGSPNYGSFPACNSSRASMFASVYPSYSAGGGADEYGSSHCVYASPAELERQREFEQHQQRRADEQERRQKSHTAMPVKVWTDEELALSKFKLAHMLYLAGRVDSARMTLAKLLDKYPATAAAMPG